MPEIQEPTEEIGPEYTFKDFARSNTTECLDPEHKMNAYMRDNGIGLLPNVAALDIEDLNATFACGAIRAYVSIPLGWFIFDDGRRVLIYDEDSQVQVNLELGTGEGLTDVDIIEQVIAQHVNNIEGAEWRTMELAGMKTLATRGIPIMGEQVDQVYIVKPTPDPNTWVICRTTCLPEAIVNTMNMVEVILGSLKYIYE
ncbi:MAG: hypothetical protein H7Y17_14790 [Chlorobia bacterium]|nr:hypothetical protein [Fimbriimonadaceae bacterium]